MMPNLRSVKLVLVLLGTTAVTCRGNPPMPEGWPEVKPQMKSPRLVSAQGAILTGKTAECIFFPCSRDAPKDVDSYWTPTIAQAKELEKYAPRAFSLGGRQYVGAEHITVPKEILWADYYRQYAGFKRKGRLFIYVNANDRNSELDTDPKTGKRTRVSHYWQTSPEAICDGGWVSFGVEYDVKTHQFLNFQTNGGA